MLKEKYIPSLSPVQIKNDPLQRVATQRIWVERRDGFEAGSTGGNGECKGAPSAHRMLDTCKQSAMNENMATVFVLLI